MNKEIKKTREEQAKDYEKIHNWLFLVDLFVMFALLILMMWRGPQGFSFAIQNELTAVVGSSPWVITAAYVFVIMTAYTLFTLPYSWWKGYYLEHQYDLSNQSFSSWLFDQLKSWLLTIAMTIIVFEIFYAFMRGTQANWWIWASCVWIVLQVILGMVFPVLILPLFYKTKPLEREDFVAKISEMASNAGVKVVGVYRLLLSEKTKKANAMLAGMGSTKRILMADTLLDEFSDDEIISVLAHEFGHNYYRHIWKLIGVATLISFLGMYLANLILIKFAAMLSITDISEIATLPLLLFALVLFSLITMPITNLLSRYFERQADRYAFEKTGDPASFISAMERLADQNLADKEPNAVIEFLMHGHPSIAKRIKLAKEWSQKND